MVKEYKYESYVDKIAKFYRDTHRLPSYSEIMKLLNFRSKNSVYKLVNKMTEQKLLSKTGNGKLSPLRIFGNIKVLGTVEAGFPSPAEEELTDTLTLDEFLINNREATYMLKIKGDSMIEAGIMAGDMVLVERGKEARDGDIVIAEIDGAWTIKYFNKRGGKVTLVPGNKKYKTLEPKESLKIAAVVVSVIRKY